MDSLPADASRYNTKRLVADLVLLVEHQEIGWPSLSFESILAMLNSPLELLSSNQYLAENGIDSGLATVEACCSNNCVLVVEQEPASGQYNVYRLHLEKITYFNRLFKTCLRSANVVFAHVCWAFVAFATIRSMPSGVTGFTRPSD